MSQRIKYIFVQESNFALKKKLFLSFTQFSNLFHNTDHLLYYPQMYVFSFHTFLFSYNSLQEMEHRNNVLSLFIQFIKVNNH